jgi:hypothetical protein
LRLFIDSSKLVPGTQSVTPLAPILGGVLTASTAKYDRGPLFDTPSHTWKYWRDDLGQYISTRKLVGTSSLHVEIGTEVLSDDRDQTVQARSGTIALTSQVFVPRPAETFDTDLGVVTIDSTIVPGPGLLDYGHDMFIFKLKMNTSLFAIFMDDGGFITVAIVNEGTSYTMNWSGLIKWPNNTPPVAPVAVGGETAVGIYEIRKIGTAFFGRPLGKSIGTSTQVDVGGVIPNPTYGYTPPVDRIKNLP